MKFSQHLVLIYLLHEDTYGVHLFLNYYKLFSNSIQILNVCCIINKVNNFEFVTKKNIILKVRENKNGP